MARRFIFATVFCTLLMNVGVSVEPPQLQADGFRASSAPTSDQSSSNEPVYLFSYFVGNGEDGLHLAYSRDAIAWHNFHGNPSWLTPKVGGKLMRDPCIIQGRDGTFHLVHTTSWSDQGIGIAHSKDLIHWEGQSFIPVMKHQPKALNCWAPEIFFDSKSDQYLIYWSTTVEGEFKETIKLDGDKLDNKPLNHRIYCTTTRDFENYTDTKLFYQPDFNVIDPVIIRHRNRDRQFVMVLKDETRNPDQKNLRVATSNNLFGPWKTGDKPFTPNWVEGPSLLRVGGEWICYFDMYTRHRFGAMKTRDFDSWTDISNEVSFPKGVRHGTAFPITAMQFQVLSKHINQNRARND